MERGLVERAQQGDQEAFATIAYAISPRLFAVAQRILRDYHAAEDATQQAIVLIWRDLPGLADPDRFDPWSYRVLVNTCFREIRRDKRTPSGLRLVESESPRMEAGSTPDDEARIADRDELRRAFDRLPTDQRAVLVLQYYLDQDHAQIAETLGIPLGTVKSRASHARQALRAALEADARAAAGGRTA